MNMPTRDYWTNALREFVDDGDSMRSYWDCAGHWTARYWKPWRNDQWICSVWREDDEMRWTALATNKAQRERIEVYRETESGAVFALLKELVLFRDRNYAKMETGRPPYRWRKHHEARLWLKTKQ